MAQKRVEFRPRRFAAPAASELWIPLPEGGMAPLRLCLAETAAEARLVEMYRALRAGGGGSCEALLSSLLEKHLSPGLCRAVAQGSRPSQLEALARSPDWNPHWQGVLLDSLGEALEVWVARGETEEMDRMLPCWFSLARQGRGRGWMEVVLHRWEEILSREALLPGERYHNFVFAARLVEQPEVPVSLLARLRRAFQVEESVHPEVYRRRFDCLSLSLSEERLSQEAARIRFLWDVELHPWHALHLLERWPGFASRLYPSDLALLLQKSPPSGRLQLVREMETLLSLCRRVSAGDGEGPPCGSPTGECWRPAMCHRP